MVASGSSIKIYFSDETTPSIEVNDTQYSSGSFGLFRAGTDASFNNIRLVDTSTRPLTFDYTGSAWSETSDAIIGSTDMSLMSNQSGDDFELDVDIKLDGTGSQASQGGVIVRGGGPDYKDAYIIMMHKTSSIQRVEIQEISASGAGTLLGYADKTIDWDVYYNLKVVANGPNIKIYFNDETTPSIYVNDTLHSEGAIGLFRAGTDALFKNTNLVTAPTPVTLPDPVHRWSFEGNYDDSVGDVDGTAIGTPIFSSKDSIDMMKGLYLDSNVSSINFGNLDLGQTFTMSFWVKPSDIHDNWMPILSKFNMPSSSTFWIGMHETDGVVRFGIYGNGSTESFIDSDLGAVIDNRWSHIVCSYDGNVQKIYVNGVLEAQSAQLNMPLNHMSGDFIVGEQLADHNTYKGILDDLRIYDVALDADAVGRIFNDQFDEQQDVSLLIDQVGFRIPDTKRAIFRSVKRSPDWNPETATYQLISKDNGAVVESGTVDYWGAKWGSYWWIADFTDYEIPGEYYMVFDGEQLPTMKSNYFKISGDLLVSEEIIQSQLDNLKSRIVDVSALPLGTPPKTIETGTIYRQAVGTLNPNTYAINEDIHIFRDCGGSNMSELESVTITTNALIDVYEYYGDELTATQKTDILDIVELAANYIKACQQLSSDPLTNGRMNHMGMGWSEEEIRTYSWRDMPEAITALVRAYSLFKDTDVTMANAWLDSAKLAYDCMTYRPYYLYEELNGPVGFANPSWNYNTLMADLRVFYDKPSSWTMPMNYNITDLRTRDIMPAVWACTQLYGVDPQEKYLDKAEEFSEVLAARQFTDFNNPIEGTYGNFYEFSGDDETFVIEMHQWARWSMGNYDPLRLKGVIELVEYRPDSVDAAKWYQMIDMYGENYVLNFDELSPFGITPLTMSETRGISFFRSLNHGANSIYGLAAINHLEIGDFLNDARYQELAARNINFITGTNPGWPNKRNSEATDWGAFSWAYGIGEASFGGTVHLPPKGSITNGFTSNSQFSLDSMNIEDGPNGIYNPGNGMYFHEDGVMHSLSFLGGAIRAEADYELTIKTTNQGRDVVSTITVTLDGTVHDFTTDINGECTITDLPLGKTGTIQLTYNSQVITKDISTLASGKKSLEVDFYDYIEIVPSLSSQLSQSEVSTLSLSITNNSANEVVVDLNLSSQGINLVEQQTQVTVPANTTVIKTINTTASNESTPYLILINVDSGYNTIQSVVKGIVN